MKSSSFTIEILPDARRIVAESGENVLETLLAHNIFLRSDCGGKGVCGKCRVETVDAAGVVNSHNSCTTVVTNDMSIRIPDESLLSAYIIAKAPAVLPKSFYSKAGKRLTTAYNPGVAVDLGTTTIAIYLTDVERKTVLSSIAVKNPQALYGDDVVNRISRIEDNTEKLLRMQQLVVNAIEWGIRALLDRTTLSEVQLSNMVVVGNPTMVHILLGVNPKSIGISPYVPQFCEAREVWGGDLGFTFSKLVVKTLPQVSGFLGGDILAAIMANELLEQPVGTLLIDLGTNGELVLKGQDGLYATSCATGPAFEGAALSCGMQAVPGAIDKVFIVNPDEKPEFSVIQENRLEPVRPSGLCGSGVISAISSMLKTGIIGSNGLYDRSSLIRGLLVSAKNSRRYQIVPAYRTAHGREISLSQKDIRAVQLGMGALKTGIAFIMRAAKFKEVRKILIAGAFGSYLNKEDLLSLGMIPSISSKNIKVVGNSAGAGAIMALCDEKYRVLAQNFADKMSVIELAEDSDFQNVFVKNLHFPHTSEKGGEREKIPCGYWF